VREHRPDVVVMDLVLPGTNGIVATRELLREDVKPRILMVSGTGQSALIAEAFRAGVVGYALKTQTIADLLVALELTARGQRYLAPSLVAQVGDGSRDNPEVNIGVTGLLTPRELEVFDLIVAGHSTEETGGLLFISPKTVETHRARINRSWVCTPLQK
jgi:DNA-binding NarL/FixJ family response regulator